MHVERGSNRRIINRREKEKTVSKDRRKGKDRRSGTERRSLQFTGFTGA